MGKEQYIIKIIQFNMKVNLLMGNLKEMGNIFEEMVIIILVNLKMVMPMEKEFNIIKIIQLNMKVNLLMENLKEMGNIFGKMENIILVNLKMV